MAKSSPSSLPLLRSLPPIWQRRLSLTAKISAGLAVLGLIALIVAVYVAKAQLPSFDELKSSPNGQMIRVHAADGTVIVSIGPSYGEWLSYDRIPAVMRDAMIATEDRRFRSHIGVDPVGVARAVKLAFQHHGDDKRLQGASTITQQVARTVFLSNKYDFGRKLREAVLALALERKFSKDEILELYLNKVYFGGGAYGIDAASRKFFGHGADHLTLPEAAVIAGLVKAPSHYSPSADIEAAKGRAGVVIQLMQETGKIGADEAAAANIAAVQFTPEPKQNSVRYFTDWALPQLEMLIDETQRPLEVWTTLDLNMQRAADAAVRANAPPGAQGALVSIDRDGAVRAMVGGTDYVSSIYNRATQAVRQPGSSFKLFVYLAALEAGHRPEDNIVDEPVTIDGWSPRNDSRHNSGNVTLRTAFAYSLNTVAAKLGQEVGFSTVADMARRFGITKVTTMGETIYAQSTDQSHVLVAPQVAAEMTDLLQTAVNTGTGRAAQIGRPVAGKTGTTSSNKDGWFLGFSSGLTTGVWMGRDDAKPIPGLHGGTAPARAFAAFMKPATANRPIEQFSTQVTLPELQLDNEEQSYFGTPDNATYVDENGNPVEPGTQPGVPGEDGQQVDADGNPLPGQSEAPPAKQDRLDQEWMDRVIGRDSPRRPPPRDDRPGLAPPTRPVERPQDSRPNQ